MKLKVVVRGISLTLLLIGMILSVFNIRTVKSEPRTWTVDNDGPADFNTIQEAINAASDGDTIYVYNGTYYESLAVNKEVFLIGEKKETTIIDGWGMMFSVIYVTADYVTINGFTVRNSGPDGFGIYLDKTTGGNIFGNIITSNTYGFWIKHAHMNIVADNIVTQNDYGIWLWVSNSNNITGNIIANTTNPYYYLGRGRGIYVVDDCSNNNIEGNTVINHVTGIYLDECEDNTINRNIVTKNVHTGILAIRSSFNNITANAVRDNRYGISVSSANILKDNNMTCNRYNLRIWSFHLSDFTNTYVDVSNTVDGKPVYFWINQHDKRVPDDAGCVAIINSTNVTVENLTLTNNDVGVWFAYTSNSTIKDANISNNTYGIKLLHCNNCTVIGNDIKNNVDIRPGVPNMGCGILLEYSSDNAIYHNNFKNIEQTYVLESSKNAWDNGVEGNHWSNYNGTDTDGNGIGDIPHRIPLHNETGHIPEPIVGYVGDRYPLTYPYGYLSSDVDNDGIIDISDVVIAGKAFASCPGHLRWDYRADINNDDVVDIFDLVLIAINFGKTA